MAQQNYGRQPNYGHYGYYGGGQMPFYAANAYYYQQPQGAYYGAGGQVNAGPAYNNNNMTPQQAVAMADRQQAAAIANQQRAVDMAQDQRNAVHQQAQMQRSQILAQNTKPTWSECEYNAAHFTEIQANIAKQQAAGVQGPRQYGYPEIIPKAGNAQAGPAVHRAPHGGYVLSEEIADPDVSQYSMLCGDGPEPRIKSLTLGGQKYAVVKVLQPRTNDPKRMSNGVHVLQAKSTGRRVVLKEMLTGTDHQYERAAAEIAVLQQVRDSGGSPNINVLIAAFWEQGSSQCNVLIEYCNEGTLQSTIDNAITNHTRCPEDFAWHVIEGMLTALAFLHYGVRNPAAPQFKFEKWNTICHLDIKPANVFLTTRHVPGHENAFPRIVLGDFGCAVSLKDLQTGKQQMDVLPGATQGWTPPEVNCNDGEGFTGIYGKVTDIWQTGAVVQTLCLLLQNPLPERVHLGRPCGSYYSTQLNNIVAKLMEPDRHRRGTAIDLWEEAMGGKKGEQTMATTQRA